jgi:hypothetical protein
MFFFLELILLIFIILVDQPDTESFLALLNFFGYLQVGAFLTVF